MKPVCGEFKNDTMSSFVAAIYFKIQQEHSEYTGKEIMPYCENKNLNDTVQGYPFSANNMVLCCSQQNQLRYENKHKAPCEWIWINSIELLQGKSRMCCTCTPIWLKLCVWRPREWSQGRKTLSKPEDHPKTPLDWILTDCIQWL